MKLDFEMSCGMHVVAETSDSGGTTLRWDVKLSVFMVGSDRVASIAAGAFRLAAHAKELIPRRPITRLAIQLQGAKAPAEARIYGVPNARNGVIGEFPDPYAEELFNAFDRGTPITLDLTYDSGEDETVLARTRGGAMGGAVGNTWTSFFPRIRRADGKMPTVAGACFGGRPAESLDRARASLVTRNPYIP